MLTKLPQKVPNGIPGNAYEGRWRWWYEGLADYMIANPTATLEEMAAHFRRSVNAISQIRNTDSFKTYFQQRREAFLQSHDHAIQQKLRGVAMEGLDIILEQFERKRDKVPLNVAKDVTMSALERLGYGNSVPSTVVNVNNGGQQVVAVGVTADQLEEARMALRRAEETRRLAPPTISNCEAVEEVERHGEEVGLAPLNLTSE